MRRRVAAWVTVGVVLAGMAGFAPVAAAATDTAPPLVLAQAQPVAAPDQAANQDFVPVDELPQDEGMPAAPLLMAAYGFAWVVLAFYLWSIWRRLGRVEREMVSLRTQIDSERKVRL